MKYLLPLLLLLYTLAPGCVAEQEDQPVRAALPLPVSTVAIPDTTIDKSLLSYNNTTSQWTLNERRYSGYAVSYYADGTLKEKFGLWHGKKQGRATRWFADKHLQEIATYHRGKLHGEKKRWSADTGHPLAAHLNYHTGKAHGEQRQWYPTGELYKKLHLNRGKEEGIQQAFRKTGELYANYEAKNGRIFGLKKAALCYGLTDENINYED